MTTEQTPLPMTPADCDLRDFAFMPLDINRLFGSRFHAVSTDAEWRAGLTLWARSFHQVPAASLPNDDVELCRLAELARDMKTWKKLKSGALYGWVLCSDGRYYHPIVAEKANEAWKRKLDQRNRSKAGNARRWGPKSDPAEQPGSKREEQKVEHGTPPDIPQAVAKGVPETSPKESHRESSKESSKESLKDPKGQGQGQGQLIPSVPDGTGDESPPAITKPKREPGSKSPEEMAKAELWKAAVALLGSQGMAESQARTFIGKLSKDHPLGDIVPEAIRVAVAEQPADARAYLTATCQRLAGARSSTPRAGKHTGFTSDYYTPNGAKQDEIPA